MPSCGTLLRVMRPRGFLHTPPHSPTHSSRAHAALSTSVLAPLHRAGSSHAAADGRHRVWPGYHAPFRRPPSIGARARRSTSRVCIPRRQVPPRWGSIRFRLASRLYAAWGCTLRVVRLTKSRKTTTRTIVLFLFACRQHAARGHGGGAGRSRRTVHPR